MNLTLEQRFFDWRCKVIEVDMTLYHGSPLWGISEIRDSRRIIPQPHGELPGQWFCVSSNDCMLNMFSEGDKSGLIFEPRRPLRIVQLDEFFYNVFSAARDTTYSNSDGYYAWYERLFGARSRWWSEQDFALHEMLAYDIDGVTFPGWTGYPSSYNDEAEIALNQRGCDALRLVQGYVRGDWYDDIKEAWKKVCALRRANALSRDEEFDICQIPT